MFSHIVLFKRTKLCPLKVDQKVDQQKRDSVLFAFTLSVQLKEDSVLFLDHFSSDGASVLFLFTLYPHLWSSDLYCFGLWVVFTWNKMAAAILVLSTFLWYLVKLAHRDRENQSIILQITFEHKKQLRRLQRRQTWRRRILQRHDKLIRQHLMLLATLVTLQLSPER